jgi:hypothetical protein
VSEVLWGLQRELEAVHGVEAGGRVEDFLITGSALERLGVAPPRAPEQVLVLEGEDELSLAVYLDPAVLAALGRVQADPRALLARGLRIFSLALEGVSHFVYLAHRAAAGRRVSLLELELQAEIDKFAVAALHLARAGGRDRLPGLIRRLFEEVTYLPHLGAEELERYRTANRLARDYCRSLLPVLAAGRIEEALQDLRRVFRLGAGEKLGHLARGLAAA